MKHIYVRYKSGKERHYHVNDVEVEALTKELSENTQLKYIFFNEESKMAIINLAEIEFTEISEEVQ